MKSPPHVRKSTRESVQWSQCWPRARLGRRSTSCWNWTEIHCLNGIKIPWFHRHRMWPLYYTVDVNIKYYTAQCDMIVPNLRDTTVKETNIDRSLVSLLPSSMHLYDYAPLWLRVGCTYQIYWYFIKNQKNLVSLVRNCPHANIFHSVTLSMHHDGDGGRLMLKRNKNIRSYL